MKLEKAVYCVASEQYSLLARQKKMWYCTLL